MADWCEFHSETVRQRDAQCSEKPSYWARKAEGCPRTTGKTLCLRRKPIYPPKQTKHTSQNTPPCGHVWSNFFFLKLLPITEDNCENQKELMPVKPQSTIDTY